MLQVLRFHRRVERVHRLGPAPLGYLLIEVARACPEARAVLAERLRLFAAIDPELVRALGADRFAPSLIDVPRDRAS